MRTTLKITFFFILVVGLMQLVKGPVVTSNFASEAPRFYVLGVKEGEYKMLLLSEAYDNPDGFQFHLNKEKVLLDVGDIHSIRVLEDTEKKQRIGFYYSNSYMSESIYDVTDNKVTPIEYRITGSIGYGLVYFFIFIASLIIAPLLSKLVFWQLAKYRNNIKKA